MEGDKVPLGDAGPPSSGDQHAAAAVGRSAAKRGR